MKHFFCCILLIISLLIFSSCSGVSQDEYDALKSENSSLKEQLDALSNSQSTSFVIEQAMTISFNFGEREGFYTGTINSNGLPDGYGEFQNNSSDNPWTYYGEWSDGHFSGNGITQWDESVHIGLYENDYMEGIGLRYLNDGSIVFCGIYKEDEPYISFIPEMSDASSSISESPTTASKDIASGELFDSISNIYSDIRLSEIEGALYIVINIAGSNVTDNTSLFFDAVSEICNTCHIEDFYSSITFTMSVDDDSVAMLNLLRYSSPTSFSSSYFVLESEYEEVFDEQYEAAYLSNDIGHSFESSLDELGEKYGVNP